MTIGHYGLHSRARGLGYLTNQGYEWKLMKSHYQLKWLKINVFGERGKPLVTNL